MSQDNPASSLVSSLASSYTPAALPATKLNAKASNTFDAKLQQTRDLLAQAAQAFGQQGVFTITQASSLGAEDVVITHIMAQLGLQIPVFVLNTGALHQPTLDLLSRTQASSKAPIKVYEPQAEAVVQFVQKNGSKAMYDSIELRKACCNVRKMEPLSRALAGMQAWITGLRREQSGTRADVPLRDDSERAANPSTGRIKFNPLAEWTWGDVWHYIALHQVDYNPLHDQFYPSIGCEPCTRAVTLGEDFRSGRWWWEDEAAKECGLHVKK